MHYSDLVCYQRRQLRRAHVLGRPHSRWSTLEPPSCAAASCITALALRGTARECKRLEVVEGLRRQTLPTVVHTREPAAATAACFDSGEARMVLCAASMGPGSPSPHAQRSSQSHLRTRWLSRDLLRSTCWAAWPSAAGCRLLHSPHWRTSRKSPRGGPLRGALLSRSPSDGHSNSFDEHRH